MGVTVDKPVALSPQAFLALLCRLTSSRPTPLQVLRIQFVARSQDHMICEGRPWVGSSVGLTRSVCERYVNKVSHCLLFALVLSFLFLYFLCVLLWWKKKRAGTHPSLLYSFLLLSYAFISFLFSLILKIQFSSGSLLPSIHLVLIPSLPPSLPTYLPHSPSLTNCHSISACHHLHPF